MFGHKCVWAQTCVGTNVSYVTGHKRVWAQTCVGTNVSGHNRVGSSMCRHKRVGSSMCRHKRVISIYVKRVISMCLGTKPQTCTFLPRHDCDHTVITCQGTNMCGHKYVWAQMCVGTNVCGHKRELRDWAQTCVGTNVSGHNRVGSSMCRHKRVGSSMCRHKRVISIYVKRVISMCLGTKPQTCTFLPRHDCDHTVITCQGTNMCGHKCVWAQTCVGTNVSYVTGHKRELRDWAQTCVGTNVSGHNRVGSSMCRHKRVISI